MKFSRKGLSDIVTNVLIILLVLVAIGIIWAFVRPAITQGAGQLQGAGDCLTIDVEPVSCNISDNTVTFKRNTGAGAIAGTKFIIEQNGGTVTCDDTGTTGKPGELSGSTSDLDTITPACSNDLASGSKVQVAALVASSDGTAKSCNANPVKVTCVA